LLVLHDRLSRFDFLNFDWLRLLGLHQDLGLQFFRLDRSLLRLVR
jgi:hypothetical protein